MKTKTIETEKLFRSQIGAYRSIANLMLESDGALTALATRASAFRRSPPNAIYGDSELAGKLNEALQAAKAAHAAVAAVIAHCGEAETLVRDELDEILDIQAENERELAFDREHSV